MSSMPPMADRPPPDPARLIAALDERREGDVLPGATVQALKRGGLDLLLASDGGASEAIREAWEGWERGRTPPGPLLEALDAAGLRAFLESLERVE